MRLGGLLPTTHGIISNALGIGFDTEAALCCELCVGGQNKHY